MEKLRDWLHGWMTTLRIMILERYTYQVLREPFDPDDFTEVSRPGTDDEEAGNGA